MNLFQLLGLSISAFFVIGVLRGIHQQRMGMWTGTAWLVLWLAAGTAIAMPELTAVVAGWLGITRGADLVFYFAILAMFVGFFAVYVRFRKLETEITTLVRHIALEGIGDDDHGPTDKPAHPVLDGRE